MLLKGAGCGGWWVGWGSFSDPWRAGLQQIYSCWLGLLRKMHCLWNARLMSVERGVNRSGDRVTTTPSIQVRVCRPDFTAGSRQR